MSIASGIDAERAETLQPIPLSRRRFRLVSPPIPLTPLVGRGESITAVTALLSRRDTRLVTLVGPGGIGKTRLALQVASHSAAAFDGQVAWAPVATATTPETVAAALAQAVGVADASAGPTIEAIKSALRDQRLLLVVDNFEQALGAAPLLSDLLAACPELSILVTSRAFLRISGERVVDVPPLATEPEPVISPAMPEAAPAVQLFAQHAASVYPAFALTTDNTPVVAEICRRLDGLPLAIELAAARGRLLPPAALLARLDQRLPQLTAGQRDAPERHRTMRDAISWSYGLLTAEEQDVFQCLGTFVGSFTLEAAEAVCQETGRDPAGADGETGRREGLSSGAGDEPNVVGLIDSLIAQSLVRAVSPNADDESPRLTMLETIREFAAETLAARGDDAPYRRHAEFYLALASRAERSFWGDEPGDVRAMLESDRGNIRAALTWALEHGETEIALRLGSAMVDPHWKTGDDAREQHRALVRALAMPGGSPSTRVQALVAVAAAAGLVGNYTSGGEIYEDARALAKSNQDELGEACALLGLGNLAVHAREVDHARACLEGALQRFRNVGARGRVGWTLCSLASLDSRDAIDEGGDPADLLRAVDRYEEALAIFRTTGERRSITRVLHGLAYVAYKQRDLPRTLEMTQTVLARDWSEGWPVYHYLVDIANIARSIGQPAVSARLVGSSEAQRWRLGHAVEPLFQAEYERDLAMTRRALGDTAFDAARSAGRALEPEQAVAEALAVAIQPSSHPPAKMALSPREIEVLRLIAAGHSDRDIAEALFIGERTVNTHVARAYAKLGVRNRAAAVAAAIAAGLVDPALTRKDPS